MITLLIASILAGQAGDVSTGKIVMYRGKSIVGAAVGCPIRHDGKEIVELGRGKFAEWRVKPGKYLLSNKISSVQADVQPGATVYVRCKIGAGIMAGGAHLSLVDEATFKSGKLEQKTLSVVE